MLPILKRFNDGGPRVIIAALGSRSRTKAMAEIPRGTGFDRESLCRAWSTGGHLEIGTVLKVISALRLQLYASPSGKVKLAVYQRHPPESPQQPHLLLASLTAAR
jgi:probable addiction module antidote protein